MYTVTYGEQIGNICQIQKHRLLHIGQEGFHLDKKANGEKQSEITFRNSDTKSTEELR